MPQNDDAARAAVGEGLRDPEGLVGQTVAGKYAVRRVLAKGGMGRIYVAEQMPLGRPVALKVLHDTLDAEGSDAPSGTFQKRFFLEAASVAKLRHPNIVVVYDYGKLEESSREAYFMAMELIEGVTLGQLLQQHGGTLTVPHALRIAREIARALREAHAQGMVHRDLKPSNVMITQTSEGEHVKVLDFGLVKLASDESEELTKEGHFLGSPKYMAPEQIRRSAIDGRADIYALGVLVYHMIAGRVPFEGAQAMQTLVAHLQEPVPPLPARSDLTPAVEQLVARCLEKEPEDRFASADAFIRALDATMRGSEGWVERSTSMSVETETLDPPSPGAISITPLSRSGPVPVLHAGTSAPGADAASSDPALAPGPSRSRRFALALLFVALAAIVAALAALAVPPNAGAPSAESVAPAGETDVPDLAIADVPVAASATPTPARFTLFLESDPLGATVMRDGAEVGTTPTFVTLDSAELARDPARFEITLAGHAPHVFTQGPSTEDARVRAELVRLPTAPAEAVEVPAPSASPTRGGGRRRPRGETSTSPDSPPPPPPPPRGEEMSIKTRR